ncbi:hypothetical protein Ari01nite_18570 [Paractinoplanes rishiriensis]|uniref:Uncharacterized protein n=1 Tax=Paractinoplanes rishiriensis TaxID=1050105 RepID=A0A919JW45_9ACTN|nr:hypothetical protein Ari01nite_18570 [Actinoplanes rishiriensis]
MTRKVTPAGVIYIKWFVFVGLMAFVSVLIGGIPVMFDGELSFVSLLGKRDILLVSVGMMISAAAELYFIRPGQDHSAMESVVLWGGLVIPAFFFVAAYGFAMPKDEPSIRIFVLSSIALTVAFVVGTVAIHLSAKGTVK